MRGLRRPKTSRMLVLSSFGLVSYGTSALIILLAFSWPRWGAYFGAVFAVPHSHAARVLLCTLGPQPLILYIRNIIPDDVNTHLLGYRALSGWGEAAFHGTGKVGER